MPPGFRRFRRYFVYPVLMITGCHFLVTGAPSPLAYVEELEGSRPVFRITESELLLQDGTRLTLPYIRSIPAGRPLFRLATRQGVEVASDGEVFGLLEIDRICGNDPVYYRKVRVNLPDLAAVLHPQGIDEKVVPRDVINMLASDFEHIRKPVRPNGYLVMDMDHFRESIIRTVGDEAKIQHAWIVTPGGHSARSGGFALRP